MNELTKDQYIRIEASKMVVALIQAGKKEFKDFATFQNDVEEFIKFINA